MGTNINLDYANYNFESLVQQLIDRVKLRGTWKDTYRSGTGQMMIELYGYVANILLYYVERRAEESYIDTARLRSSVINLVRILNYLPKRNTSSVGKLKFSLSDALVNKVFIPKYTECQTSGGIKYLTTEEAVIMPGQLEVEVYGIQGELVEINLVSGGLLNQEYYISDINVENTNLFIYVNGTEWTNVSSFITSTNISENFRIRPELDDTITIIFGDNIFGKSPDSGDDVIIRYVKSKGLEGNVYDLDKVTTLNSTLYDEQSNSVSVSVTNTDVFIGGDDKESTEEIRNEAPKVFKTGDRAVTKTDFTSIIINYAGVADVNVWGENEESPPNYNMFNRVKLCVLLQGWQLPSTTVKQELSDFLYTKSMLTVKYEFIDAIMLDVIPTLTVKILSGYSLSQMQSTIESTIADQFVLGGTTNLGKSKRYSDLMALVDNLLGVSYLHLVLEIMKIIPVGVSYNYEGTLDAVPILPLGVRVFDGDTQIGVDNGVGGWVNTDSVYVVSGVVNYVTGVVGIDINPTPSGTVYVRYQQNANGDIILKKNEICKLYKTDVTNISYVE